MKPSAISTSAKANTLPKVHLLAAPREMQDDPRRQPRDHRERGLARQRPHRPVKVQGLARPLGGLDHHGATTVKKPIARLPTPAASTLAAAAPLVNSALSSARGWLIVLLLAQSMGATFVMNAPKSPPTPAAKNARMNRTINAQRTLGASASLNP